MSLSPALDTALRGPTPTIFGAVQIDLPDATIRWLDGAGYLATSPWNTFASRDPVYGALVALDALSDGGGDEAPAIAITIAPAGDAAAAALSSPAMQGSTVRLWLGAVDPATGAVLGDPELLMLGELDVPTIKLGANSRQLDYEVTSVFERFFDDDQGARLVDTFHQSIWPGELGMAGVSDVTRKIYWGMAAVADPIATVRGLGGFNAQPAYDYSSGYGWY